MTEQTDRRHRYAAPQGVAELADLGGGLTLCLDLPAADADPDPCLILRHVLARLDVDVPLARLGLLSPAEFEGVYSWAAAELVRREARPGGRLAERAMPRALSRLRRG